MTDRKIGLGEFLVLAPADADAAKLTARQVLAPRIYSGGVNSSVHDISGESSAVIVWFLEWADGLMACCGLAMGEVPNADGLYWAALEACAGAKFGIEHLEPVNAIPC